MANRSLLRLNGLLREELSELLRRETEDPELQGLISIVEVETSADLKVAKVYVSMLGTEEEMARVMRRLQKAGRFFRRELARRVNLRHTPELEFHLDPSIARGARVMELLAKLQSEEGR